MIVPTVGQAPTATASVSRGTSAARAATGQDFDSVLQGEVRGRDDRSARVDHTDRAASPDHADRPARPARPDHSGQRGAQTQDDASSAVDPKALLAATATDTPVQTPVDQLMSTLVAAAVPAAISTPGGQGRPVAGTTTTGDLAPATDLRSTAVVVPAVAVAVPGGLAATAPASQAVVVPAAAVAVSAGRAATAPTVVAGSPTPGAPVLPVMPGALADPSAARGSDVRAPGAPVSVAAAPAALTAVPTHGARADMSASAAPAATLATSAVGRDGLAGALVATTATAQTVAAVADDKPAADPQVVAAGALTATSATTTTPTVSPAAATPAAQPAPLAEQLGARLVTLRGLGNGEHVLNIAVDPEHFGPVRVVAHITPDAVRIELLGATDQSRAALRASLADLRRDLAGSGLHAELSLGRDAQAGSDGWRGSAGAQGDGVGPGPGSRGRPELRDADRVAAAPRTTLPDPARSASRPGGLDVLV